MRSARSVLLRELGEGGFARVFLAEQADLDHRLVVVKVSTRITPEPRLLARARHSHIVEVLWHNLIEDGSLQLVCMPFLGGATLAAVLADRKRRGGRPRSGRDLLAELDRVSAPEYPTADLARSSREIIARLSYPKAIAWIVARLAEALDYAYSRGVLHGDVKPSNILLTADGEPMLLDFNLAVGWQSPGGDDLPGDVGGTLAYMAPERLRTVAEPENAVVPKAADRHRADLYALGMVLLEALAGRTADHPRGSPRTPRELAKALRRISAAGSGDIDPVVPDLDRARFAVDPDPLPGARSSRSLHSRLRAGGGPGSLVQRASPGFCPGTALAVRRAPLGSTPSPGRGRRGGVAGRCGRQHSGSLDCGPDLAPGEGPGQARPPLG